MEAPAHAYREFTALLGEESLYQLALQYGAAHQRERKLPIRIFFWLMVLSAGQPTARGGLFQLVAFFVGRRRRGCPPNGGLGGESAPPTWPAFRPPRP